MNTLTPNTNQHSIEYIREQIRRKISPTPYLANNNTVTHTMTDIDHHPYTRWFRGVSYYSDPVIMEREAGYRKIQNGCYGLEIPPSVVKDEPGVCFEVPCSTVLPCYPGLSSRYSDKEKLDMAVNDACVVQYR